MCTREMFIANSANVYPNNLPTPRTNTVLKLPEAPWDILLQHRCPTVLGCSRSHELQYLQQTNYPLI